MSIAYMLICMDCEKAISLSKMIHVNYKDWPHQMYGFSNLGGRGDDGYWKPWRDGCEDLQQFLVLHRMHELRVMSERADAYGPIPAFPSGEFGDNEPYDYSREALFEAPMLEPDPENEVKNLPQSVKDRLSNFQDWAFDDDGNKVLIVKPDKK